MFLTGVTAASSVYGNCIHIEAMEKLMESFHWQGKQHHQHQKCSALCYIIITNFSFVILCFKF